MKKTHALHSTHQVLQHPFIMRCTLVSSRGQPAHLSSACGIRFVAESRFDVARYPLLPLTLNERNHDPQPHSPKHGKKENKVVKGFVSKVKCVIVPTNVQLAVLTTNPCPCRYDPLALVKKIFHLTPHFVQWKDYFCLQKAR